MSLELETTIEDAITDVTTPDIDTDVSSDTSTDDAISASPESDQIESPAVTGAQFDDPTTVQKAEDEFAKRFGLPQQQSGARENRIPYHRVKAIIAKNEKDTRTKVQKEIEATFQPKITEYETKVRDYETRLNQVSQFEHVLENDPKTFLNMLSEVPAYKEFFDYVSQLASAQTGEKTTAVAATDIMPQPDQTLQDGSKVYSEEGFQKFTEWQERRLEDKLSKQFEQRYAPIEQTFQSQRQLAAAQSRVQQTIAEARKWPNFEELENDVVEVLKADPSISLERAYMKAFQDKQVPKLSNDRNKIREEVLAELQKAPKSTSAPSRSSRPASDTPTGPQSLEDIIKREIDKIR